MRLAKIDSKYNISYKNLKDSLLKEKIPNNILLSINEKVLLDDLVKIICEKFGGKNFDVKNNLISFNAEDRQNENIDFVKLKLIDSGISNKKNYSIPITQYPLLNTKKAVPIKLKRLIKM